MGIWGEEVTGRYGNFISFVTLGEFKYIQHHWQCVIVNLNTFIKLRRPNVFRSTFSSVYRCITQTNCANWIGNSTPLILILSVILHTLMRCVDKFCPCQEPMSIHTSLLLSLAEHDGRYGIDLKDDLDFCIKATHNPMQVICAVMSIYTCTSVCLLYVEPGSCCSLCCSLVPGEVYVVTWLWCRRINQPTTERCRLIYQFFILSFLSLSICPMNPVSVRPTFIIKKNFSTWNDAHTLWATSKKCAQSKQHVLK